eukprot:SAG31_NODE_13351_length_875_cov_1.012887_2_plen_98_part_00
MRAQDAADFARDGEPQQSITFFCGRLVFKSQACTGLIGKQEFRLLLEYVVHFSHLMQLFDVIEDESHDRRLSFEEFRDGCEVRFIFSNCFIILVTVS